MLQRVGRASVRVGAEVVGQIDGGWLVLLGVARGDADADADRLADKVVGLRAFDDAAGKMNRAVGDVGGSILVVSQFTLLGDCTAGRRPSFGAAADPAEAERLYLRFVAQVRAAGIEAATGRFRAAMQVELVNDGPATFVLDSR